jgi:hypothetical protein
MKEILAEIDRSIPRYDEYLLRGFMAEQISGAAEFVHTMFGEAVQLFCGAIEYRGYSVVPPERRALYEIEPPRAGCRVTTSDLLLVEYMFVYAGRPYPVPLYIPYLHNDVIRIEDTTYVLQRSIKEQAFSRIAHGVTMKVIRQPIPFYCNRWYRLESVADGWTDNEQVATTSIHQSKAKGSKGGRLPDATIIHYLLCKFGFTGTLARFGLLPEDCAFVPRVGSDTDAFRYFAAHQVKKKQPVELFLKVRTAKLVDPVVVKLIASILYTLTAFPKQRVEDLYDPTGGRFRIMLGKIINGNGVNEILCKNKIDTHIASVDKYLDPITRARLHSYGIDVVDIYDLLHYVFCEIDRLVRIAHTDLYSSRIDYLEELLVETIVKSVYLRWYTAIQRLGGNAMEIDPRKLNDNEVRRILRIPDNLITRLHDSQIVQKSPPAYGDNAMTGWLIGKMRQSGQSRSKRIINSPDHRFDPSMMVVETAIAFSKSNPGAAGAINPYLRIKSNGSVIRPDFADEIDALRQYLPY